MRGEVFWGIVEKYWVLNAWCDILNVNCGMIAFRDMQQDEMGMSD